MRVKSPLLACRGHLLAAYGFPFSGHTGRAEEALQVIYCQMRVRVKLEVQEPLMLEQVAEVAGADASVIPIPCPKQPGVWNVEAIDAAQALAQAYPEEEITLLGPDTCYVHRVETRQRDPWRWLRTAAAFGVMLFGSMLGLAWFHSDVDMPRAMELLFTLVTGNAPPDQRWITLPYALGVALGVCIFYAIPKGKAVTPLEVKLTEYQGDMEQTEGRSIHGEE